jgi:hypothetical protein
MELTKQQLDGFIYAIELAADDQENYLDSGNAELDYTAEDMRSKAQYLKDTAEAAYCIGQTGLGDRFENMSDTARMLADSMESETILCECGREEQDCAVFEGAEQHRDRT